MASERTMKLNQQLSDTASTNTNKAAGLLQRTSIICGHVPCPTLVQDMSMMHAEIKTPNEVTHTVSHTVTSNYWLDAFQRSVVDSEKQGFYFFWVRLTNWTWIKQCVLTPDLDLENTPKMCFIVDKINMCGCHIYIYIYIIFSIVTTWGAFHETQRKNPTQNNKYIQICSYNISLRLIVLFM